MNTNPQVISRACMKVCPNHTPHNPLTHGTEQIVMCVFFQLSTGSPQPSARRSLLRWIELWLHTTVVVFCIWTLTARGFELSKDVRSGKRSFPGLRNGWLWGWKIDLSDIQWREFRGALPTFSLAMLGFVILSSLIRRFSPVGHVHWCAGISVVLVGYLHGSYMIHLLVAIFLNYAACKTAAGTSTGPAIIWGLNSAMLFLARRWDGIPFSTLSDNLVWLDKYKGPLRWYTGFNLCILRLMSFSMDCHWAMLARAAKQDPDIKTRDSLKTMKIRAATSLPIYHYNLVNYLAYVLYPPLYVAGPTSTFNNFGWQLLKRETPNWTKILAYGVRGGMAFMVLEVICHTIYANGMAKYSMWKSNGTMKVLDVSALGFWVLIFMWLKFLVIWRYFRFWSLLDGIEVPENMCRCVCNNYDIEGFWKNWHASFNLWLVRYLYIPLGGSRMRILNIWCIFSFVALWHDLNWKLLGWGWIMASFLAAETVAKIVAKQPCVNAHSGKWWYRHLCALLTSLNIGILMTANMVGFVVGLQGAWEMLKEILSSSAFVVNASLSFYCAAHLMFEVRDMEANAGRRLCPVW